MLYNIMKRMIERGETDGLVEKLDVFYLKNKVSKQQYEEISSMLGQRDSNK